jgi:hypothetical protein
MFTVSGVALSRVDKIGPLTVNAAEVIPAAWAGIPDEYSTVGPGGPGSGAVAGGNVPAALRAFIEILREVV